jgi:hypothetical protein
MAGSKGWHRVNRVGPGGAAWGWSAAGSPPAHHGGDGSWRDDWFDGCVGQGFAAPVGIRRAACGKRAAGRPLDQCRRAAQVIGPSGQRAAAGQVAGRIGNGHDPARVAAARSSGCLDFSPRKAGTSSATARLTHPGKGHGPCHSARLILGQLWAKAPSQGPPRPRRALASVGAGCTGLGGRVVQGRGKRGSPFLIPPEGAIPFPGSKGSSRQAGGRIAYSAPCQRAQTKRGQKAFMTGAVRSRV